ISYSAKHDSARVTFLPPASLKLALDFRLTTLYIPGIFIPANRRAKLGLPICLNIFFICAYWRSRLFTSCTVVPEPREMRLRRLPLFTSWVFRFYIVFEFFMVLQRV